MHGRLAFVGTNTSMPGMEQKGLLLSLHEKRDK